MKVLSLIILFGLFLVSCSQEIQKNNPYEVFQNQTVDKIKGEIVLPECQYLVITPFQMYNQGDTLTVVRKNLKGKGHPFGGYDYEYGFEGYYITKDSIYDFVPMKEFEESVYRL